MPLQQLEAPVDDDETARHPVITGTGQSAHEARWRPGGRFGARRGAPSPQPGSDGLRVIAVRDIYESPACMRRSAPERDNRRAAGLLELAQRAHSLTESEIQAQALELVGELTASPAGYVSSWHCPKRRSSNSPRAGAAPRRARRCRC